MEEIQYLDHKFLEVLVLRDLIDIGLLLGKLDHGLDQIVDHDLVTGFEFGLVSIELLLHVVVKPVNFCVRLDKNGFDFVEVVVQER